MRPPPENLAAQFPRGSWFEVYDYGVGDGVVWPTTVSVSLVRAGVYRVVTAGEVAVTVPNNAQIEYAAL